MEEQELMAELESIISNAAKDIKQERIGNSLESLELMFGEWRKQDEIMRNGQAWFIGLDKNNALFPSDDLNDAVHLDTSATGMPDANRMAVRCIATPESASAFINMLDDPRFVMVEHQMLRPDGVYGMFTSDEGTVCAVSLDRGGMAFIVEGDNGRFAKAYGFGTDDEPEWRDMGGDQQTMEWVALVMKAFMAPRVMMDRSPHMYKAFLTGIAAGEQDILDAFGITAEQLLEGLNDI